jgi:hypothetical protein
LPKDLPGALERLEDAEVDALRAAVSAEAERRGRLPPTRLREGSTTEARSGPRRAAADGGVASLTTGRLNAVRGPPRSRGSSGSHKLT